jgi:hypothetical protein
MDELMSLAAKRCGVSVKYVRGSWVDVNVLVDLQNAGEL